MYYQWFLLWWWWFFDKRICQIFVETRYTVLKSQGDDKNCKNRGSPFSCLQPMFTLYRMAYALTRKPYWKRLLFTHKIDDIGAYSAQRRLLKWKVTCRIRCSNYNGKIFVSAWKAIRFCVKIAFVQVPYNGNEYHFKCYSLALYGRPL